MRQNLFKQSIEIVTSEDSPEATCRAIIKLALEPEFDSQQEGDIGLARIYDLAVRYLDKEIEDKTAIWSEMQRLALTGRRQT